MIKVFKKKFFGKGQSLAEAVILFVVVSVAVVTMQLYAKGMIQRKTKVLTDEIINKKGLAPQPYAAKDAWSKSGSSSFGTTTVSTEKGGLVNKEINETATSNSESWSESKFGKIK